ncbi:MAG: (Fe-S)-binding protein [Gammaproteobacteria bacterium]|nr:(Fe-S)-binding protein [Gammaproteobacteria bacterium]
MKVALFSTCLIDSFRPSAGFAAISLLEAAGFQVDVPVNQTCCGQPGYNNGDIKTSRKIAQQVIETFSQYDYVIVPSASCAGMIIKHYPAIFEDSPEWHSKANDLSTRCYELVSFLHDIVDYKKLFNQISTASKQQYSITYHDSCSSLREIDIQQQTRKLISHSENIKLVELNDNDTCCGFGGTFCVKYPEISEQMVNDKVANIEATGADMLVSGDMGCLLNIAGRLKRLNNPIKIFHIAELLAGEIYTAGIGDSSKITTNKDGA